jgi:hypothetical protein
MDCKSGRGQAPEIIIDPLQAFLDRERTVGKADWQDTF